MKIIESKTRMAATAEQLGHLRTAFNRPRSIRSRVVVLVGIVVIPLLALFTWIAVNFATSKRELIEQQRLDATHRLSSAVDLDIATQFGMLSGLSVSDDLGSAFKTFRRQAEALMLHPHVVRIWAFDEDGKFVAGARSADRRSSHGDILEEAFIERTFSGANAVSGIKGEGLTDATVVIAVPVRKNKKTRYGLAAEIHVSYLDSVFAEVGLDPEWPAAVVDKEGRYVARSINASQRIGQKARPELGAVAAGYDATGFFENVTWEGVQSLNAFQRSNLTGWTAVVAVPEQKMNAPIRNAILLIVLGAASVLGLTLLLAMFVAKQISEPVRGLSRYASALAGGQHYHDVAYGISELEEVGAALDAAMAKNSRLAAIVASSGDAIMSIDLDGTVRTWNSAAEELFGYSAEEIVGKPKTLIVPADHIDEYYEQRTRIVAGEIIHAETVRKKKDGTRVHVRLNAAPVYKADGKIIAISSIIHDITSRKEDESHRQFLTRELAHRSKNQLAIVQSIANQTGRNAKSVPEFVATFTSRLKSLAVSHELLVSRDWLDGPLRELVKLQLSAFVDDHVKDRIDVSGPHVIVSATAAQAIGLALHELATNAVKYGALSEPQGRIKLHWSVKDDRLSIDWIEEGGPKIEKPPEQTGFGSRVIETMAASTVSGKANIDYHRDGLRWHLEFDLPVAAAAAAAAAAEVSSSQAPPA